MIRKPRGGLGPFSVGLAIILGSFAGTYIWGPSIQEYLNTDPEIVAWRQKSKIEREIDRTVQQIEGNKKAN